jgi:hypothetical protein
MTRRKDGFITLTSARSISTEKRRRSLDDSGDSGDTTEIRSDKESAEPVPKKAIILPILGKHRKEALLKAAATPEKTIPATVPVSVTPETSAKKRRPGRPRKSAAQTPW